MKINTKVKAGTRSGCGPTPPRLPTPDPVFEVWAVKINTKVKAGAREGCTPPPRDPRRPSDI